MRKEAILIAVVLALVAGQRGEATCRSVAGFQEYYVLGREDHIYAMFVDVDAAEGGVAVVQGAMESVVTMAASTDGQQIYYDHWEDGYDLDPSVPGLTTESYSLNRGEVLSLRSDGSGPGLRQAVPASPRGTELRYDGGDRVFAAGGPVALVHNLWPTDYAFIGGAFELYARQAVDRAFAYVAPLGVDSYDGDDGLFAPFKYVWLELQAFEDDTAVRVQNAGGTVFVNLDAGETYSTRGSVDDRVESSISVTQGTRVNAAKPVQAAMVTAGDSRYQSRFFTLLPQRIWERDYITPIVGPSDTTRGVNLYMFNPSSSPISVTAFDSSNTAGELRVVPPNTALAYNDPINGWGRLLPAGSPTRVSSDEVFWGVVAMDWTGTSSDWGCTLLPTHYLSDNVVASWSPGSDDQTAPAGPDTNVSPVHLVPLADTTFICADLDGDGTTDDVDTDGDGTADPGDADYDADGLPDAGCYDTSLMAAPRGLRLYDAGDADMSGARIFGTGPFTASFGQDADTADGGVLSELDLGYNVLPGDQRFLDPVLTLDAYTADSAVFETGGTYDFTVEVRSHGFSPIDAVGLVATIPSVMMYVPASTTVVLPDTTIITLEPTITLGPAMSTLDWSGLATLTNEEQLTVTFQASIAGVEPNRRYNVAFETMGNYETRSLTAADCVDVFKTWVQLAKIVDRTDAGPSDILTYGLDFARSPDPGAPDTLSRVIVRDVIAPGLSYVAGTANYALSSGASGAGSYDEATRTVTFPEFDSILSSSLNLTGSFTFQAMVDPQPTVDRVCNTGAAMSLETPPSMPMISSAEVCTNVLRPELVMTKFAPPTVAMGQRYTYTIEVQNVGTAVAADLTISDQVPLEVSYIPESMLIDDGTGPRALTDTGADGDGGEFDLTSVIATLPSLAGGQTAWLTFEARAPSTPDTDIANVGLVDAGPIPPTFTNLTLTRTGRSPATIALTDVAATPQGIYVVGADVYVQVDDVDQNVDPLLADSVSVTVTDPATGDTETVVIAESTIDVGSFFGGSIATVIETPSPVPGDGTLEVRNLSEIVATYIDASDPGDTAEARATVVLTTPSQVEVADASGTPVAALVRSDLAFAWVADSDEDRDVFATDTVPSSLTSLVTGDVEALSCDEIAVNGGTFLSVTGVVMVPATNAPVANDGQLEVIGGDDVIADYVDPNDSSDTATDTVPVVGVNLLRNDAFTTLGGPLGPLRSAIFADAEPGLDGRGADTIPQVGEGAVASDIGSTDDDDFYLPLVLSPLTDPDSGVVTDVARPLVFYETDAPGNTLRLAKDPGGLLLSF